MKKQITQGEYINDKGFEELPDCRCREIVGLIREAVENPKRFDWCNYCKWEDVDFEKYCQDCQFELKDKEV
jgi:hypothetical protein